MLGYESAQDLFKADLATQVFRNISDYQLMNESLANANELKDIELEWNDRRRAHRGAVFRTPRRRKDGGPGYFEVLPRM